MTGSDGTPVSISIYRAPTTGRLVLGTGCRFICLYLNPRTQNSVICTGEKLTRQQRELNKKKDAHWPALLTWGVKVKIWFLITYSLEVPRTPICRYGRPLKFIFLFRPV